MLGIKYSHLCAKLEIDFRYAHDRAIFSPFIAGAILCFLWWVIFVLSFAGFFFN